jgi:predicted RNA-binding Zn ribbon-like protein
MMAKIETNQESWKFVGGRLCLDFINTVGGRARTSNVLRDKLRHYGNLLDWSRSAGVINQSQARSLNRLAGSRRHDAQATLARAVLLRESLYRLFKAAIEGRRPRPSDLNTLSAELLVARAHQRLAHAAGAFSWAWDDADPALDRILWPISLSAADLLTSPDRLRLRHCEGTDCGWMFLDSSRNRSRHWCDMKDCGNRAKVRRFRKRQLRGPGPIRASK